MAARHRAVGVFSLLHVQAIRGSWHDRSPHGSVSCSLVPRRGGSLQAPTLYYGELNSSPSSSPLSGVPCHWCDQGEELSLLTQSGFPARKQHPA